MSRPFAIEVIPAEAGQTRPNAIVHDRRQMPVGQGGFHVGALRALTLDDLFGSRRGVARFQAADYLYVYDCGSEPKAAVIREIKALAAARTSQRLDVLVLSHFDRDHICGTPHLLHAKTGLRVDTIVLPYINDVEQIAAFARAAAAVEDHGGEIDDFFSDLCVDPVGTLAAFGPERIILVRAEGPDGAVDETGPKGEPDEPADGERKTRDRSRREPDLIAKDPARPIDQVRLPQRRGAEVLSVRNAALRAVDPTTAIAWKLSPHVRDADPADLAKFRTEVETRMGWGPGTFAAQVARPAIRRQLVTTKRTPLAAAYREAFGDKNLTSLSLYSGPLEPETLDARCVDHDLPLHPLTKIGWLGTGDAHLRLGADIAAFKAGLGADLDLVCTFVLPHHGSIENSDPTALVSQAEQWVASADPIHNWKHPHWKLQAAVDGLGANFHHVRASEHSAFDECFHVARRGVTGPFWACGPDWLCWHID